eukprot:m.464119 g.464119  ORF g.464119 m.464119 type:complete len:960 (+) comp23345_c0_seq1:126-3005(+)
MNCQILQQGSTTMSVTRTGFGGSLAVAICSTVLLLAGDVTLAQNTVCPPLPLGAAFQVTSASPTITCLSGGGPQSETEGTCYTTNGGTCITDGPGNFQNNERCTIAVHRSITLAVHNLTLTSDDSFGILFQNGTSVSGLQTPLQLNTVEVNAGDILTWTAGQSGTQDGFVLCEALPCPAAHPEAFFNVSHADPVYRCVGGGGPTTDAEGTCFVTDNGNCFTDGPGRFDNNEECTISVLADTRLLAPQYALGTSNIFRVSGSSDLIRTEAALNSTLVRAGDTIVWTAGTRAEGFTICAAPPCQATPTPAYFTVVDASPDFRCNGGGGPSVPGEGTCYIHDSGRCVSKANGRTDSCTIQVHRDSTLAVFNLSQSSAFFNISDVQYSTPLSLNSLTVPSGGVIQWQSTTNVDGWTLCAAQPCDPTPFGAFFQVTHADPVFGCVGGGGPAVEALGTCFTTNGGLCFTDGPGDYGPNERCTIRTLRDTRLTVQSYDGQRNDYFTVGTSTTQLNTRDAVNNLLVPANTDIRWQSNGVTQGAGWIICASGACPPVSSNAKFAVTAASPRYLCDGGGGPDSASTGSCFVSPNGQCVTNGGGGPSVTCTVRILTDVFLGSTTFSVNQPQDFFSINGVPTTLSRSGAVAVSAGSNLTWASDISSSSTWTLCDVTSAPTAPTANPTVTPTAAPTARPSSPPTTADPTTSPTDLPTTSPTGAPSAQPTTTPTAAPSATPTALPTALPTTSPTLNPTAAVVAASSGGGFNILIVVVVLVVVILLLVGTVIAIKRRGRASEKRDAVQNYAYDPTFPTIQGFNTAMMRATSNVPGNEFGYVDVGEDEEPQDGSYETIEHEDAGAGAAYLAPVPLNDANNAGMYDARTLPPSLGGPAEPLYDDSMPPGSGSGVAVYATASQSPPQPMYDVAAAGGATHEGTHEDQQQNTTYDLAAPNTAGKGRMVMEADDPEEWS